MASSPKVHQFENVALADANNKLPPIIARINRLLIRIRGHLLQS